MSRDLLLLLRNSSRRMLGSARIDTSPPIPVPLHWVDHPAPALGERFSPVTAEDGYLTTLEEVLRVAQME